RKQRHVSRCTKWSSGWKRACRRVAKLDRHVFHQRNDFQHKLSRELVNNYGIIAVEDLNIQGLAGGRLAKSVHDAAWSGFIRKLSYKAESAGRWLVKVNARGTSQQCPCGRPVPKKLWDRKHHGSACGVEKGRTFRISVPKFGSWVGYYRILAHQRSRFNRYYFYIRDEVLGPIVLRVASFLPFSRHLLAQRPLLHRAGTESQPYLLQKRNAAR